MFFLGFYEWELPACKLTVCYCIDGPCRSMTNPWGRIVVGFRPNRPNRHHFWWSLEVGAGGIAHSQVWLPGWGCSMMLQFCCYFMKISPWIWDAIPWSSHYTLLNLYISWWNPFLIFESSFLIDSIPTVGEFSPLFPWVIFTDHSFKTRNGILSTTPSTGGNGEKVWSIGTQKMLGIWRNLDQKPSQARWKKRTAPLWEWWGLNLPGRYDSQACPHTFAIGSQGSWELGVLDLSRLQRWGLAMNNKWLTMRNNA